MSAGAAKNVTVFAEDVTEEVRSAAIEIAQNTFLSTLTSGKVFSTVAATIRGELDKKFGGNWSIIVGKSFGTMVTHEQKTYMYFSVVPGVNVLIWRS